MVWAGVTADRRTDLVDVPGILTGQRYIDEILRPHVVPFLRPLGNNGIFQDDNARPHRARIVDGFLQANNVRRLEWPAMSPDLSCIEHVWDVLGRAVQKRTQHYGRSPAFPWRGMAANPSSYDPKACVFNTEETY